MYDEKFKGWTIEKKMERLEEILELLENANVELSSGVELYEEGFALLSMINKELEETKTKIETIESDKK
ncbi:MAG: exodeoxyribonuclease VII small subunit [Bacillota bacterium]|jgi:exodeoxyribonuclease VII small subunit|nr:exodeoxyribonuclease VII small subunit [Bacillota bacterium]MDY0118239.1 exodeoxyribonuclease VII small subunit [Bacilli bacterium]